MARIFISHKNDDKPIILPIVRKIEDQLGEKCWIDLKNIESDSQFADVICNAINECEVFLFMYTKRVAETTDFQHDWMSREINYAEKRRKRIVIVNVDGSELNDHYDLLFGTKHNVDVRNEERLAKLYEDLRKWLSTIKIIETTNFNDTPNSVDRRNKKSKNLNHNYFCSKDRFVCIRSFFKKRFWLFCVILSIIGVITSVAIFDNSNQDNEYNFIEQKRAEDSCSFASLPYIEVSHREKEKIVQQILDNLVYVEGGSFEMGTDSPERGDEETSPSHTVELSSFYISKYELRQEEWIAIMNNNPSHHIGRNFPVENVSYYSIQKFLRKLSELSGIKFRLPTEAEWEYAASGGQRSKNFKYSGSNNIDDVAWTWKNSGDNDYTHIEYVWDVEIGNDPKNNFHTHEVGMKKSNELGIYDMTGNVLEICQDLYDEDFYKKSPYYNPVSKQGEFRQIRGGAFDSRIDFMYVKFRNSVCTDYEAEQRIGFRIVAEKL